MQVHKMLFNYEKFILIKPIRQPVLYDSEFPHALNNFIVEASDQELLLGQAYSNLNDVRSCGQFQGIPLPNALNELLCPRGTVGRYVYIMQKFSYIFGIAEFEVYPSRE